MAYSRDSTHGHVAEINIVPLADVLLVLLVVFMLATPALTRRMELDMPGAASDRTHLDQAPAIRLRIDAGGEVYWNGSATPASALEPMMAAEVERDPALTPRLEIDASGESDYQALARVLAAAHNADLRRIAFVRN